MKTLLKTAIAGALVAGALALFSSPAQALSATSNMSVSMNVAANCTISAGALAFGAYDPVTANATTPLDQAAVLTLNCTSGAATTITMGQGLNAATGSTAAAPLRRALSGLNTLAYSLYSDSARTTVWGDTAGTGKAYTGTGASDTSVQVFGRVPAGQNVPAGAYNDTVVATITF